MGFIPSIGRHYPADILQHLPLSFDLASMYTFARGRELGIKDGRFESGKRQEMHYFLSGKFFKEVWKDMNIFSQQPGYQHFQKMFLLLDAKDLKLQLKGSTVGETWQLFSELLDGELDFTCLDPDFKFLDLGQELLSQKRNTICFYKSCCLKQEGLHIRESSPGIKVSNYTWALNSLTANQTLEYSKSSSHYQSGLRYSQYYSPLKSLFDAAGTYPFENTSLDYLSLSPEIFKLWQSASREKDGFKVDIAKLEKSYLHSRDRILQALREAIKQKRSFGIRQEHRISFQLFHSLAARETEISMLQTFDCIFSQNAEEAFHFLYTNMLRFGLALEYTASRLQKPNSDEVEHLSRMFRMFLQLVKASYTTILLPAYGDLWRETIGSGDNTIAGLSMKSQLEIFKFGWLPFSIIDWNRWRLDQVFSKSKAFKFIHIHSTGRNKTRYLLSQKNEWEIAEQLGGLLKRLGDPNSHKTYKILAFLGTMVIQKFRTDVWSALFKFSAPEWIEQAAEKKEKALKGQLPLDYENIISFAPSKFSRIKFSNKHKINLQERWEILFHTNDKWDKQEMRKAWNDKPYRLFFQKCLTTITSCCDLETARCWEYLLVQTQFVRSNFLLPSPSKYSFLQRNSSKGELPRIYWVPLQHNSWEKDPELRILPAKGSKEDQWSQWYIDYSSAIPAKYQSPDILFMEKLQYEQVLERFEKTI